MKITHAQVKQIIKEELENVMKENDAGFNPYNAQELEDRAATVYDSNPQNNQVQVLMDAGFEDWQIQILIDLKIIDVEAGSANKDLSSKSWNMNQRG